MPRTAVSTNLPDSIFFHFFLSRKRWKGATLESTEVIIKPDLLGHHMWRKVLLGLRIHTQGVKQRKGKKQPYWQLSLGSVNNG